MENRVIQREREEEGKPPVPIKERGAVCTLFAAMTL